jgi:hypothetical protein
MDELFRFSVLRPADRAQPNALDLLPLSTKPPTHLDLDLKQPQLPIIPQLQQKISAAQAGDDTWKLLETGCREYLTTPHSYDGGESNCLPALLFTDPDNGADLFSALKSFVFLLQSITVDKLTPDQWPGGAKYNAKDNWPTDAANISLAYYGKANTLNRGTTTNDFNTQLKNWRQDLAAIFFTLLVIRTDGTYNLNAWIMALDQNFWTSTGFFIDDPSLRELGNVICGIDLLLADPASLTSGDIVLAKLTQTLIVPPGVFTKLAKPLHAIGIREFHVVKQHLRGYELGEIATIENILKGESRKHATSHTLSNETDTFDQTQTTDTESKELTTTDHVDIKNESDNQVKEDTKVDGGVHAQISGGSSFKLQTDISASYDKSSDTTQKFASDVSKDITSKVASTITTQVTQSQTTKIIETWQETEDHSFDNKKGKENISGIYQWVEKTYLAQTFNIGRHLIFDITVPEPGASLIALASVQPPNQKIPVPPDPLGTTQVDGTFVPLKPDDLINGTDTTPASSWIAKYQVTGIDAPPALKKTFAMSFAAQPNGEGNILQNDTIRIDDGYEASDADVLVAWQQREEDGDSVVDVQVGNYDFAFGKGVFYQKTIGYSYSGLINNPMNKEQGEIAVSCKSIYTDTAAVNIEVNCTLVSLESWAQQAYGKIVAAYQKLLSDYNSALAAQQFQPGQIGPLGSQDPAQNRLTERIELKRSCIAILDNDNSTVRGTGSAVAVQNYPAAGPSSATSPVLPEPFLPSDGPSAIGASLAETLGARVRWFEQAFEWENIAYISYPYFWGRRSQWVQSLNLKLQYPDPLFMNFLQAGYTRVVVPVRLGFEREVHCYLHNGRPWLGGELPLIGDRTQHPLYLDIAEEIKANTGGGESGDLNIPIGDPWEIVLPTSLMKLRKDTPAQDPLPSWVRVDPKLKGNNPDYPSDPPIGPWTWKEENPPASLPYSTS